MPLQTTTPCVKDSLPRLSRTGKFAWPSKVDSTGGKTKGTWENPSDPSSFCICGVSPTPRRLVESMTWDHQSESSPLRRSRARCFQYAMLLMFGAAYSGWQ